MNIIINGYDQLHQIFSAFPSQKLHCISHRAIAWRTPLCQSRTTGDGWQRPRPAVHCRHCRYSGIVFGGWPRLKHKCRNRFLKTLSWKQSFKHGLLHFCSGLTHVMVLNGMLFFLSFKRSSAILWLSTGPRWNQLKSTVEKGIRSHADHENPSIATSWAALFYNWHGGKKTLIHISFI